MRVERVPQVELDPERLVAGDQAAPDRRERLHDADREHDPDQQPASAVRSPSLDRSDDARRSATGTRACPPARRSRGRPRRSSETRYGAQEPEQAPEGGAVAGRWPVGDHRRPAYAPGVAAPRVGACCRSSRCRTSRRAATAATIDAIGAALAAHARLLDVHATPTTTARCSRVVGQRATSSSRRSSPPSRSRASGSTCAATRARIRGSARPTSSRSSRSSRGDLERAQRAARVARRADRRARACRSSSTRRPSAARPSTGGAASRSSQRRLDARRARARLRPGAARPVRGRRDRRRPPAADRVQRQPARPARGRARDRRGRPRARRRLPAASGRSGSSCRGSGSCRCR